MKKKDDMVAAICKELILRKSEAFNQTIQTIYFGGGTPSVLSLSEILEIIAVIYAQYTVAKTPEITLEANPDDLTLDKIKELAQSPINRLSIGVQSFFEDDLKLMNRAHNAQEAKQSIGHVKEYFDNISIDLIYGVPGMTIQRWKENLAIALAYEIPHISSYALTVESNTALEKYIAKGVIAPVEEALAQAHFEILERTLIEAGYEHYELSNFGKPDYFSQNNTAYWQGKSYLGIGPSAHSYDGHRRSWNVKNNSKYIKALQANQLPSETEVLSTRDRYNEYIMTGLRTIWGVSLLRIEQEFGSAYKQYLLQQSEKYIEEYLLCIDEDVLLVTKKGKFLCDGIASDLFLVNLSK